MKFINFFILICFFTQIYGKNKHVSNNTSKKQAVIDSIKNNVLNLTQQEEEEQQQQREVNSSFLQTEPEQQTIYLNNQDLNSYPDTTYKKSDFYLWEEGVTNLAYDDFIAEKTQFITNIEYLGSGYNLARGNPFSTTGVDPGYKGYSAFKLEYQKDKLKALTADREFFIPDGVTLKSKATCEVSFNSNESSTMKEYEVNLSFGAEFEGGGFGFDYKASMEYKQQQNSLEKSDRTTISSTANCMIHKVSANEFEQPEWSNTLNIALQKVLDRNTSEQVYSFFENFGTHITVAVELGAKFGYNYELRKSEVDQMKSESINVEASASGFGYSGSMSSSYDSSSRDRFASALTNWSQYSIGAPPNENNDAFEWASECKDSPMPIKGTFLTIPQFIERFSEGNTVFSEDQLNQLSNIFQQNYDSYCTDFLRPRNIVGSCEYLRDDKTIFNVPGGKLQPGISYNSEGGNSMAFRWDAVDGVNNAWQIASDELGYLYYIVYTGQIYCRKPGQQNFEQIYGKLAIYISAANGRIVIVEKDTQDLHVMHVSRNYGWKNIKGGMYWNPTIDSNGYVWAMLGLNGRNNMCLYRDPHTLVNCIYDSHEVVWWQANYNGLFYRDRGTGDSMLWYNHSNVRADSVQLINHQRTISGCLSNDVWGYTIWDDHQIYFYQEVNNIPYSSQGQVVSSSGVGTPKQISCDNTPVGPYVFLLSQEGQIYQRKIDL